MELVGWSEDILVGIEKIDEHHKTLFDLLNKVYAASMYSRQAETLKPIIKELVEYTKYHFDAETDMMKEHSYPKRTEHEKEHSVFADHIRKFQMEIDAGREELVVETVELTLFLAEWLANHIKVVDKEYAGFLHERGVS